MSLEGLAAHELTPGFGPRPAWAWALPGEREVARAVFHARLRVFEKLEAGADAAITVPLCDPGPDGALGCKPVLGLASCRCFFDINPRRNRWLAERK